MSKFVKANEKIAEKVVEGYKKLEDGVVEGFGKVTDVCVETLFAGEGETKEDAKKRLSGNKSCINGSRLPPWHDTYRQKKEGIVMKTTDQEFLIQKIRTQYTEKEHTNLDKFKALDAKVKRHAKDYFS